LSHRFPEIFGTLFVNSSVVPAASSSSLVQSQVSGQARL
jgi:hypothetical protein